MDNELKEKIAEILILSRYEEIIPCGATAQEIQHFKDKAFNMYLGKIETKDDPYIIIHYNTFHAKVDRDLGLILKVIDKYNLEGNYDNRRS